MKKAGGVLMVVVALFVAASLAYLRRGHDYVISQSEIQSHMASQFPVRKCVLIFCIELSQPFVRLTDRQARIDFGSNARMEIAFSSDKYDGSVGFSGELDYQPESGAFYVRDSRLEYLQVSNVSDKHKKNLDQLADQLVSDYLRANPVYSFKGTALEWAAPWIRLKQATIRDGVLRLRLGIGV